MALLQECTTALGFAVWDPESGAYRFRVYVKDPELIKITFLILLEKLRDTHGQKGTTINVAVNPLKFKPE